MASSKVRVTICGTDYVIGTTEDEAYVQSLAEKLNKDMMDMMAEVPSASVTMAAVIAAMDYLDDLKKTANGADNMRAQIREYLDDAAKCKQAADEAHREVERLRVEIERLRKNS